MAGVGRGWILRKLPGPEGTPGLLGQLQSQRNYTLNHPYKPQLYTRNHLKLKPRYKGLLSEYVSLTDRNL